ITTVKKLIRCVNMADYKIQKGKLRDVSGGKRGTSKYAGFLEYLKTNWEKRNLKELLEFHRHDLPTFHSNTDNVSERGILGIKDVTDAGNDLPRACHLVVNVHSAERSEGLQRSIDGTEASYRLPQYYDQIAGMQAIRDLVPRRPAEFIASSILYSYPSKI